MKRKRNGNSQKIYWKDISISCIVNTIIMLPTLAVLQAFLGSVCEASVPSFGSDERLYPGATLLSWSRGVLSLICMCNGFCASFRVARDSTSAAAPAVKRALSTIVDHKIAQRVFRESNYPY